MKHFFSAVLFAAFCSPILSQQKFEARELKGAGANSIFPNAEFIWLKQENTIPAFIQFRNGSAPTENDFFLGLKKIFQLPSNYSFQLLQNEKDQFGWEHHRYQLAVNGVPVNNGIFLTHLRNGKVEKYNGYLFKNISASTSPAVNETAALQYALNDIHASVYKWQVSAEEEFLKLETGNSSATYFPKGELFIVQNGKNISNDFRLCWRFDVYAQQPFSRQYIFVDAQSGEVIKKLNRIHEADAIGTATTVYRGNKTIHSDSYNGAYRLRDASRGLGVRTFNMQQGTSYGNSVDFTDGNNVWNNVNANLDQYAGDAHWGAEMTYDFFLQMGRNSIDNAGYQLNLYVHYDVNYVNAFWDGTRMTFGDGNNNYEPLTSLDITGHEIGHGLTERTSNLDYQDESGALNESFSDIFGACVEWFADSTLGNWLIAEDIGTPFRSMSNPNTYGDPDTYGGTNWYTGTNDNGGVHTNSGVQNHWFYRLSQGGSGTNDLGNAYNVTGITRSKAKYIAWRNDTYYLTNTADYADARFYAIQSANDIYGACSQEAISTTNAWYAVGVGAAFVFGVDAQFTGSPLANCSVPFTVNFVNTSTNSNSYTWDFGDATTSTATNPSHTYNTLGNFTVRLLSNGGACGNDSLVRTNYVSISPTNPCVAIMPVSGTGTTQTSCSGILYDDGGPAGNYADNTTSTITIAPSGATNVTLHFTQFRMEDTYDFLYVYDGPTTASPLVGTFTGTNLPADITSSGSSITIRKTSDQYITDAGFTINWSCTLLSPPVANFVADVTNTCNGLVNFTDLSTFAPNAWTWNFGDGGTSNAQNPSHTYFTNGTFTVTLSATNAIGTNAITKTNYITVSKPAAPATTGASRCGTGTLTISATSTDTVKWYAAPTSTTVLSTGNSFVTPSLSSTTTYYAERTVAGATPHVGPTSNAIGTGGYINGSQYLIFRVLKPCTLQSVYVYANGAGNRTFELRNKSQTVLASSTQNVANGGSRITLNFVLSVGDSFQLGFPSGTTINLYRNDAGAVYPYNDANGNVSIIGNTANLSARYYYCYDWILKEQNCISLRAPTVATIHPSISATASHTNVLCNGGNTGSATVSATGGTPNFSYSWTGGATSATANNLSAGTYNVTVTDAAGCTATATQTVTQPTALSISAVVTPDTCNKGVGRIVSTVSGGTSGYSYLWSNAQTTSTANNLIGGNYTLTVTDANNCTATAVRTVSSVLGNISLSASHTNVLCNGGNTGSATVSATSGTAPFTYLWSNSGTTSTISNLSSGTFNVTVTDAGGCSSTASQVVTQPTAISIGTTITPDTCNRGVGRIVSTVSGGTSGYTYVWSNSGTTATITNLIAGNYTLTVNDANNCSSTAAGTITEVMTNITVNASHTNVLCNGGNSGSATVSPTSGTQPYGYLWSNSGTTSTINNLVAGTYTVTVADGGGCSATASQTVTQPNAITIGTTITPDTCARSVGKIVVNVSGGISGYTYLWSNAQTTSSIQNLNGGNYTLTVTDANNCSSTIAATVTIAGGNITANTSHTNVLCNGGNTGSATVSPTSGTQPFTYLWSNNGTTSTINNLTVGTYTVTVNDVNSCSATSSQTVTQPNALTSSATSNQPACNGGSNGSITLQPLGGTPSYSYNWSNGATTITAQNLSAGNYSVTILDANNCSIITSVQLNQPTAISLSSNSSNATCAGNDGSASVSANGGTPNYSYQWNTGATASAVQNIPAGIYLVTVTDANNCTATSSATVNAPGGVSVNSSSANILCFGQTGSASVVVTSGLSPYSYNWNTGATTSSITITSGGNFSVTVTDGNNCSAISNFTISAPSAALNATPSSTHATCAGNDGTASLSVNGGTPNYTYNWSNGATSSSQNNLQTGNYFATVTDVNNCSVTVVANVGSSGSVTLTSNSTTTNCFGGSDGSATVNTIAGAAPFTYNWSSGATTQTASNLSAGNYSVTVTDGNSCISSATVTVNEPSAINIQASTVEAQCPGDANGSIALQVTGGTSAYTYSWNTGATSFFINNLTAGNYSVTVTDSHNCTAQEVVDVTEPSSVSLNTTSIDAICFEATNGSAAVAPTGGTPPYSYNWCNGSTASTASNLSAGNCSVTVTDAHNCTSTASVTINEPADISFTTSVTDASNGQNNGSATVNVSGGTSPYTIQWSNGGDGTNLASGTYTFTVTDDNGCFKTGSVLVGEVTAVIVVEENNVVNVFPNPATERFTVYSSQFSIDEVKLINAIGQVLIYQSSINKHQFGIDVSNLAAGIYAAEIKTQGKKLLKKLVIER